MEPFECSMLMCDSETVSVSENRRTQADTDKFQCKREAEEHHGAMDTANDWIKRESDVYNIEESFVDEELLTKPTVSQSSYAVTIKPEVDGLQVKLEPVSPNREPSVAASLSPRTSDAGAVPNTGDAVNASPKDYQYVQILLTCNICNEKFTTLSNLNRHSVLKHTDVQKLFSCKTCHAKFTWPSKLKRHMRVHTRDKPFSCKNCDAKFTEAGSLKRHFRMHTGEKPFSCTTCDEKFAQSCSLKRHMKNNHSDEKPFSCTVCNEKFAQSSSLPRHMRRLHPVPKKKF